MMRKAISPRCSEKTLDAGICSNPPMAGARVGDLIQWDSNGVLQLERPMRVRLVEEIGGRQFVVVEGSETGIPMDQVIVEQRAAIALPAHALTPEASRTRRARRSTRSPR